MNNLAECAVDIEGEKRNSLGNELSKKLFLELAKDTKLYDPDYNPEDDTDLDPIWIEKFKSRITEDRPELGILADTNTQELRKLLEEDASLKQYVSKTLPTIEYRAGKETVSFGADDLDTHLERLKAWLGVQLDSYRYSRWVDNGFLSDYDKKYLIEAREALQETVKKSEDVHSIVFLTTGARLLYPFIKGMTDESSYLYGNQVTTSFLQCSRKAESEEVAQISKRVEEIIKNNRPPYLIIDDYVTNEHATHDLVVSLFETYGISADQIRYFAFIGEGATEEETLDKSYYRKMGINVGTLDAHSSYGFMFNTDAKKGTLKDNVSKYEDRLSLSKLDRVKMINARKSLYYYGKHLSISLEKEQQ